MLGENIESVNVMTGTGEELLAKDIDEKARFVISTVETVIENYKLFLREYPVHCAKEYMDLTLKLISNLAINMIVPFINGVSPEAKEFVFKETVSMLSKMINIGWISIKAEDDSKEQPSH